MGIRADQGQRGEQGTRQRKRVWRSTKANGFPRLEHEKGVGYDRHKPVAPPHPPPPAGDISLAKFENTEAIYLVWDPRLIENEDRSFLPPSLSWPIPRTGDRRLRAQRPKQSSEPDRVAFADHP